MSRGLVEVTNWFKAKGIRVSTRVSPALLGYSQSVCNKNSTLEGAHGRKGVFRKKERSKGENRGVERGGRK